jgi:hypothetical protein
LIARNQPFILMMQATPCRYETLDDEKHSHIFLLCL